MNKLQKVSKLLLAAIFAVSLSSGVIKAAVSMEKSGEPVVENGGSATEDQDSDVAQKRDGDGENMSQEDVEKVLEKDQFERPELYLDEDDI